MGRRPFRRFRYQRRAPWERPWKPRGPLLAGRMLNPRLQNEIRRANHLMAVGDHLNAARIFENLALKAVDLNFVYPAPMLFMQAAHAHALGGDLRNSLDIGRRGLEMLVAQERRDQLIFEGSRLADTMESGGNSENAEMIRDFLDELLPDDQRQPSKRCSGAKTIPEKCPYCGATMDLESLVSNQQASECQYCGSIVMARPEA
ncbi:MAG: hypothetical protein ACRDFQ_00390 [Anaerolineales bacterium]